MMALIEELLPICRTIGVTGCAGRWRSCGGTFRSKGTMWLRERRFNWCIRARVEHGYFPRILPSNPQCEQFPGIFNQSY